MADVGPSEVTPEHLYVSRRRFITGVGITTAALLLNSCKVPSASPSPAPSNIPTDELGAPETSYKDITNYNNFYEFSQNKEGIGILAKDFQTSPWSVAVGGLVNNPRTYTVDELITKFTPQERIYRMRCVEAWSMIIPWLGFPLSRMLDEVAPKPEAKFVRFEAIYDKKQMGGQYDNSFKWPYVEGLRLDEAQHNLTILATGLYGKPLPVQDGAPIRLVVPWKYGFKSIKSIVKIDLVTEMPVSLWTAYAPGEYGFYSNVNPDVPHPRWAQSSERRIGEFARRPTLLFNGYGDQVSGLYQGMDLKKFY